MIEGRVCHSKSYKRVTKRNSNTICYTNQARQQCFGYARFYVKCFKACRIPGFCDKDCVCRVPKYVVVLDRAIPHIDPTASPKKCLFCLPHIKPHKKGQSELDCCFVEDIEQLCVEINSLKLDLNFICLFPNFIESDQSNLLIKVCLFYLPCQYSLKLRNDGNNMYMSAFFTCLRQIWCEILTVYCFCQTPED